MFFFSRKRKNNTKAAAGNAAARKGMAVEGLEARLMMAGQPWNWAAKQIGQDLAVQNYPSLNGAGQTVVVIDSGVDYRHPSLGGGFGNGFKVVAGHDFMNDDGDPFPDTFAHGTGAAGVIAANGYYVNGKYAQGIAPAAKLIALRQKGSAQVLESLNWVLANRTKYNIVAVNMCDYGGGNALAYKGVLKQLIAAGVFVAHPSGNAGPARPVGAALDPADFAVGATNSSGQVADFTQRGAELDLLAPGEHVLLPYYDVATKQHIYVDTADGTSWATPAVVGTAALIKQIDPKFTPLQVMKIMQDSGTGVYDPATKLTYKRLNVNAALALAYQRRTGGAPAPTPTTPQAPLPSGPVEVPGAQSPFGGKRIRIEKDTILQAENFDDGGEGVSYHDAESKNLATSKYREGTGVDLNANALGGIDLVYVKAGEWVEYSVDVAQAGTYTFTARASSLGDGGKFHVEVDGADRTGQVAVNNTGRWQAYSTLTKTGVQLSAGQHTIRIKMNANGKVGYVGNFDWFRFTQTAAAAPATTNPAPATTTTTAKSALAPLAAVNYSAASGVTKTNVLGSLDQGDWVAYKGLNFGSAGLTRFSAGVAAAPGMGGKKIQIRLGSPTGVVVGTLTVTATGSWGTFKTQSTAIARTTGTHDVYLTFAGGAGVANVQWVKFG